MPDVCPRTNPHAAQLRRDMTEAERRLWLALRDRRLGGAKFRRQASVGPFVVDFLCVAARLVVEVDGGQHGEDADRQRTRFLEAQRLRVIRFWNHEVMGNFEGVLMAIAAEIEAAGTPSPQPSPASGRGSDL